VLCNDARIILSGASVAVALYATMWWIDWLGRDANGYPRVCIPMQTGYGKGCSGTIGTME
jgi:hypothetical protein